MEERDTIQVVQDQWRCVEQFAGRIIHKGKRVIS